MTSYERIGAHSIEQYIFLRTLRRVGHVIHMKNRGYRVGFSLNG